MLAAYFHCEAEKMANKFINPLENNQAVYTSDLKHLNNELIKERISQRYNILSNHKNHHKTVLITMFEYRFSTVTFLLFFSILTAILSLKVGQKGWAQLSSTYKTLFLTFAGLTSFYGYSAATYQQASAIEINLKAYNEFDRIEKYLYASLRVDSSVTVIDSIKTMDTFLYEIDTLVMNSSQLFFSLEDNAVTSEDITKFVNRDDAR